MTSRYCFLLNAKAGNSAEEPLRQAIKRHLEPRGLGWKLVVRRKGQGRKKLTRKALDADFDVIVAAGGDGTVSRVAHVLAGTDVPLGIVPMGTANLLARDLGVPLDLDAAVAAIVDDPDSVPVDAMRIGKKLYFSHISIGTYSRITKQESAREKKLLGRFAYVRRMLSEAARGQSWAFEIETDDRTRRTQASLVIVANIAAVGLGDMRWGEHIRPDDGVIDICICQAEGVADHAELISTSLGDRTSESPHMEYLKARRRVRIRCVEPLPLRADGSIIGQQAAEVEVMRGVVRVLCQHPCRPAD